MEIDDEDVRIAVATSDGKNIDSGFGNASRFDVYSVKNSDMRFERTVEVDSTKEVAGTSHKEHIEDIANLINDCRFVVVKEIGSMPSNILTKRGKVICIRSGKVDIDTISSCFDLPSA